MWCKNLLPPPKKNVFEGFKIKNIGVSQKIIFIINQKFQGKNILRVFVIFESFHKLLSFGMWFSF